MARPRDPEKPQKPAHRGGSVDVSRPQDEFRASIVPVSAIFEFCRDRRGGDRVAASVAGRQLDLITTRQLLAAGDQQGRDRHAPAPADSCTASTAASTSGDILRSFRGHVHSRPCSRSTARLLSAIARRSRSGGCGRSMVPLTPRSSATPAATAAASAFIASRVCTPPSAPSATASRSPRRPAPWCWTSPPRPRAMSSSGRSERRTR